MARKRKRRRENIYLGKSVPDTGREGLDNLGEVKGIAYAIYRDYRSGRISKKLAIRRLNFLKLIVSRDRDFQSPSKKRKAREIIERYIERIK